NLRPVLTMTLGVNDATTLQLASIAAFIASGKVVRPALIHQVKQSGDFHILGKPARFPAPVRESTIQQVRDAMRGVLQKQHEGTASSAGSQVRKALGEDALQRAGAKTGTVQSSKGVSCIGFLGPFAGAITLSTPQNDKLKTFRIRRSIIRKRKRYQRLQKLWLLRYQRARSGSRRARVSLRKAETYQRRSNTLQQRIQRIKAQAKQINTLRKNIKVYAQQRKQRLAQNKQLIRSIRRNQRRITRIQRRLRSLYRRKRTIRNAMKDNPSTRKQRRRQQRRQRIIAQLDSVLENLNEQYQQRLEIQTQQQHTLQKNRRDIPKITQKQREVRKTYRKLYPTFRKFHEPWKLSSSHACRILFAL
ncbi:MAG: penicillin-binding transpeptidase domain-containing protein, partial [Myxococcota bacterium]